MSVTGSTTIATAISREERDVEEFSRLVSTLCVPCNVKKGRR